MKSEHIVTVLFALVIGYLVYLILAPFFIPIFWASVFAILLHPYYSRLLKLVRGRRSLASLLACATIALFIMAPMGFVGAALADDFVRLYQWAEGHIKDLTGRAHGSPLYLAPYFERFIGRYVDVTQAEIQDYMARAVREAASYAAAGLKGFIKSFAEFLLNASLAFLIMFFLFRDGGALLDAVKKMLPLREEHTERLFRRIRSVIYATVNGGVAVGAVQGVLGGAAFWALGLSGPVVWGFTMFLLSFLPGVGTAMVWGPGAIYLLITGEYWKAAALFAWGALIIGLADNVLRPMVVSGSTNLHPLLLFLSILGAVNAFGLIGVIAGPLILSIAVAMAEMYLEHQKDMGATGG
jgi:predicted PurR-regulated permease PerM